MTRSMTTSGRLHGQMRVPGSKSLTNRALVCAALASGESVLHRASDSDDTALLANGLNQFGILVRKTDDRLVVHGRGGKLNAPKYPVPVGNAGTTLRFLLALAALAEGRTVFQSSERMARRPNDDLLEALRSLGAGVVHVKGSTQFEVVGSGLSGGTVSIRSESSSQFLSAILLVSPYAPKALRVRSQGALASAPYVALTLDVMRHFGVDVVEDPDGAFAVPPSSHYRPAEYPVEADASGALYPFAAAAIAGGEVYVPGVQTSSRQADAAFPGILQKMGCQVLQRGDGTVVGREGPLRGLDVRMNAMPDAVPALVAVALFADGPTQIDDVGHLRFKESNRLDGLAAELSKLGADIRITGDSIRITPCPLHGASLETHGDHRLAMVYGLIGLLVSGITIDDPDCVRKSFPRFWQEFEGLIQNSTDHPRATGAYGRQYDR